MLKQLNLVALPTVNEEHLSDSTFKIQEYSLPLKFDSKDLTKYCNKRTGRVINFSGYRELVMYESMEDKLCISS